MHSIAHFNPQSGELGRHPGYALLVAPPTMLALRPPQALIRLALAWRLEDSPFMLKCCSLRVTYLQFELIYGHDSYALFNT